MQFKRLLIIAVLFGVVCTTAHAQEHTDGPVIECFSDETRHHKLQDGIPTRKSVNKTLSTFLFNATCINVPAEAIPGVARALNIWGQYITTSVPINIEIQWISFPNNALASARPSKLFRKLSNAAYPDHWYPVALAEKIERRNLNGEREPDILVAINESVNWYFGTDAIPPADKMDLITVIVHEICHGLGFLTSAKVTGNLGRFDEKGQLLLLDQFIYNRDGISIHALQGPSERLFREFTSDHLYFRQTVKMYAPPVFDSISSICHFDESIYAAGHEDALMTPFFKSGEAIHTPGAALLEVLDILGWQEKKDPLSVFPNPSNGLICVEATPGVIIISLKIVDSHGSTISTYNNCCDIQLQLPCCGTFIVVAHSSHGVITRRVVVK